MAIVAPSLLSGDFSRLGEEVQELERLKVDYIHIDVMDGHYVPNLTYGPPVIQAIRPHTDLPFDVHLMIEAPEQSFEDYIAAGADRISFHPGATIHSHRLITAIREAGVSPGIAINPGESFLPYAPLLNFVDFVLIMSVNPGFGGQSFIPEMVEKVRALREYATERKLTFEIEVDGGVNDLTGRELVLAGADALVAGSYIFSAPDKEAAIQALRAL